MKKYLSVAVLTATMGYVAGSNVDEVMAETEILKGIKTEIEMTDKTEMDMIKLHLGKPYCQAVNDKYGSKVCTAASLVNNGGIGIFLREDINTDGEVTKRYIKIAGRNDWEVEVIK